MNDHAPPDLVLLQTFHEVARTGSVTRAAENLGRSQPAVSHRLRALEADLGVPLFEKAGRRLRLTEYGRRLQGECVDLMERSRRVRERVGNCEAEVQGRIVVGTLPTVASHLLTPVLRELLDSSPRVALELRFDYVPPLADALRAGDADVLVVIGREGLGKLETECIGQVSIAAVVAPELAPARRRDVAPEELRRMRYLSFGGRRDPTFDRVDAYAREHELENECTPRIPNIEALRELAAAGAGYALLPAYTTLRDREQGRLVALWPSGLEEHLEVLVVGRPEQVRTPALDAVRDALRSVGSLLSGDARRAPVVPPPPTPSSS